MRNWKQIMANFFRRLYNFRHMNGHCLEETNILPGKMALMLIVLPTVLRIIAVLVTSDLSVILVGRWVISLVTVALGWLKSKWLLPLAARPPRLGPLRKYRLLITEINDRPTRRTTTGIAA